MILDSNDIILDSQLNNNHSSISPIHQSEQIIQTKYRNLLVKFFETHQPSYIFEPLRKEYYWNNEPFNEDKITQLDKYDFKNRLII